MVDAPIALSDLLLSGYNDLRRRLARRLGSADLANDVLHETWLRLRSRPADANAIQRPQDYLFRVALNIASDMRRSDRRRLSYSEVEALYHYAGTTQNLAQDMEARSEVTVLAHALNELPARQRSILIAVRVHGTTHAELAQRFGISERMVDKDLRRALEFCAEQVERTLFTRFGSRPAKTSIK